MNIVLTCLDNFQEYILTNIEQLIKLNHKNIYVITNSHLFNKFENHKDKITLIDSNTLNDRYNYASKTTLNKTFRNGFWYLTSMRFFYIYEFMKQYNIEDVIHLENDVLIYYNCDEIINKFDKKYIYIPFDSYKRNIASIMYIPNATVFKKIIDNYDINKNDMENFSIIKQRTELIQNLPIFINNNSLTIEQKFVSTNSDKFPFIFDAAAIGQYVGGVDPKNSPGNTVGFINETCVIKYNNYKIIFKIVDGLNKPFIIIHDKEYPIFNLHIHSKNLVKFV
jgi:hypothetical protein